MNEYIIIITIRVFGGQFLTFDILVSFVCSFLCGQPRSDVH